MIRRFLSWFTAGLCLGTAAQAAEPVDYLRDVKPVLQARCYACHGALKQEADLRLDTAQMLRSGGASGPAAVAGNPADSLLLARVRAGEGERMPPEGEPLTPEQISTLAAWIEAGAQGPAEETAEAAPDEHWAFRRIEQPAVPAVSDPAFSTQPIDAFIAAQYEAQGLTPVGLASRNAWLRRVTLDLTGLPPTRSELAAFLADESPEAESAVVERLLSSPQYGERWARHWLDVWRYADWFGRRNVPDWWNSAPQIWRWRDWLVRSLNDDRGYDYLVQSMLAADELFPTEDESAVATGYLVRNWYALNQNHWMRENVEHVGKAFLGLTFNCAHCHDHKYDPILQTDYFRLRACFEPLHLRQSRERGEPDPGPFQEYDYSSLRKVVTSGSIRTWDKFPDKPTYLYARGDERNRFPGEPTVTPGVPEFLGGELPIEPIALPLPAYYPALRPFMQETLLREAAEHVEQAQTQTAAAQAALSAAIATAPAVAPTEATPPAVAPALPALGYWRFEGSDDGEFLSDSSAHGGNLERLTQSDPPAQVLPLLPGGWGEAFPRSSDANRNTQAAAFCQEQGFGYLAAAPFDDWPARDCTCRMLVQIATASVDFNRTLAELEGRWTWLHRGLDEQRSELRLLLYNAAGETLDLATGAGEAPLILVTGHAYSLTLVVSAEEATFYARDLTTNGPLQQWAAPRNPPGQDFRELHAAGPARFKIGNSDGTGRHVGLIDEVLLLGHALAPGEVAAWELPLQPGPASEVLAAETALDAARAAEATAVADAASVPLRISAETDRYSPAEPDVLAASTGAALEAEHFWQQRVLDEALVQARQAVLSARVALNAADANTAAALATAEAAMTQATLARLRSTTQPPATYRPLGEVFSSTSTGRRAALARWMTSRDNPLAARVAVNHVWKWHFGRPLVDSVFDFGRNGKPPSHPELLDWLAAELMEHGWSLKHLHRLIVHSRTYHLTSAADANSAAQQARDTDNRYLWHFPAQRMEAETLRDSLLYLGGELDLTLGGPPIDNPDELASCRRSLYHSIYPEDGGQLRFNDLFDAPDPCDCYRRTESIVPQQALALTNSRLALRASRLLAARLTTETALETATGPDADEAFIAAAYETILGRSATPEEQRLCGEFLRSQTELFTASPAPAAADAQIPPPATDPAQRARESLVRVILNHNDFIAIR